MQTSHAAVVRKAGQSKATASVPAPVLSGFGLIAPSNPIFLGHLDQVPELENVLYCRRDDTEYIEMC